MISKLLHDVAEQAAGPLVDIAGAALAAGTTWLIARLGRWIDAHAKNARVRGALDRLNAAVGAAVLDVEQTMVKKAKEKSADGRLTPLDVVAIKQAALDTAKSHLGTGAIEELKTILGAEDVTKLIESHIEAAVHALPSNN